MEILDDLNNSQFYFHLQEYFLFRDGDILGKFED